MVSIDIYNLNLESNIIVPSLSFLSGPNFINGWFKRMAVPESTFGVFIPELKTAFSADHSIAHFCLFCRYENASWRQKT